MEKKWSSLPKKDSEPWDDEQQQLELSTSIENVGNANVSAVVATSNQGKNDEFSDSSAGNKVPSSTSDDDGDKEEDHGEEQRKDDNVNKEENLKVTHEEQNVRLGRLISILPGMSTLQSNERMLADFLVYFEASVFLALQQFNDRRGDILNHLPGRLQDCDFYWALDFADSQFSPLMAASKLFASNNLIKSSNHSVGRGTEKANTSENMSNVTACQAHSDFPFALVGAGLSEVSKTLSLLADSLRVPLISPSSTSADLDKSSHFARTVPTTSGDARAFALYLWDLGVSHVGVLYVQDAHGIDFYNALSYELQERGIVIYSASYMDPYGSAENSIRQLKDWRLRYYVGIFNPGSWRSIVRLAHSYGIMGHSGYTWMFTEGSIEFTSPTFSLNRETEADLAKALHGTGLVSIDLPSHDAFHSALKKFACNQSLQQEFINYHDEPSIFYGYKFSKKPSTSIYHYFAFDAAMSLGIASCETSGSFTGDELYLKLLQTEFEGVSGHVSFNPETGTREEKNFSYGVFNLLLSDQRSTNSHFFFSSQKVAEVEFATNWTHMIGDFVFADNSTVKPMVLPPIEEELNLISTGCKTIGLSLGVFVMVMSLYWVAWTWVHREAHVIRVSQPLFLCQLGIGTFIVSSVVIPMSLEEPIPLEWLGVACMTCPWIICIGFAITFSGVFSKTWRLNRLFQSGKACRRIQVRPKDVMYPFFILMALNIIFLVLWTVLVPFRWVRVEMPNFDEFGRSIESYGTCMPQGNRAWGNPIVLTIMIPLIFINTTAVLIAAYQLYIARTLPTEFSEASYMKLSVVSLLEASIVVSPILVVITDNPSVYFLVRSILVCVCCLGILLPIFLPKYKRVQMEKWKAAGGASLMSKLDMASSSVGSKRLQVSRYESSAISKLMVSSHRSGYSGVSGLSGKSGVSVDGGHVSDFDVNDEQNQAGMMSIKRCDEYYEQIEYEEEIQWQFDLASNFSSGLSSAVSSTVDTINETLQDSFNMLKTTFSDDFPLDASNFFNSLRGSGSIRGDGSGYSDPANDIVFNGHGSSDSFIPIDPPFSKNINASLGNNVPLTPQFGRGPPKRGRGLTRSTSRRKRKRNHGAGNQFMSNSLKDRVTLAQSRSGLTQSNSFKMRNRYLGVPMASTDDDLQSSKSKLGSSKSSKSRRERLLSMSELNNRSMPELGSYTNYRDKFIADGAGLNYIEEATEEDGSDRLDFMDALLEDGAFSKEVDLIDQLIAESKLEGSFGGLGDGQNQIMSKSSSTSSSSESMPKPSSMSISKSISKSLSMSNLLSKSCLIPSSAIVNLHDNLTTSTVRSSRDLSPIKGFSNESLSESPENEDESPNGNSSKDQLNYEWASRNEVKQESVGVGSTSEELNSSCTPKSLSVRDRSIDGFSDESGEETEKLRGWLPCSGELEPENNFI